MTREEAIKLIDTHTVCFYNEIDSPTLQALHLAIEALQTEPVHCEECKYLGIKDFVYGYCKKNMVGEVQPDEYCSYGERRRAKK